MHVRDHPDAQIHDHFRWRGRNVHFPRGPGRNACAMNWTAAWKLGGHLHQIEDGLLRSLGPAQRDEVASVRKAFAKESTIEMFTFLGYDEDGMIIGSTGAHRLLCVANSGAIAVIFGREMEMKNVNAVLKAGLPCVVRCEPYPGSETVGRVFGHTHWVWEHSMLESAPLAFEKSLERGLCLSHTSQSESDARRGRTFRVSLCTIMRRSTGPRPCVGTSSCSWNSPAGRSDSAHRPRICRRAPPAVRESDCRQQRRHFRQKCIRSVMTVTLVWKLTWTCESRSGAPFRSSHPGIPVSWSTHQIADTDCGIAPSPISLATHGPCNGFR